MIESDTVLSHMKGSMVITCIVIGIFVVLGLFYETFKWAAVFMFFFTLLAELANYMDMKRLLDRNSSEK